jgi:ABC-type multidrug transport system ATPase subunit
MNMVVGLTVPTAGAAAVLGGRPAGSPAALDGVAFVAQDAPVYKNLSSGDMLHLTANLNQRFDLSFAKARLSDLGIPLKKKAGKLSGGQQAQLALTLALARKPQLLILDEPLASLDPVARQDFLSAVLTAMADDGVSVLLSSPAPPTPRPPHRYPSAPPVPARPAHSPPDTRPSADPPATLPGRSLRPRLPSPTRRICCASAQLGTRF